MSELLLQDLEVEGIEELDDVEGGVPTDDGNDEDDTILMAGLGTPDEVEAIPDVDLWEAALIPANDDLTKTGKKKKRKRKGLEGAGATRLTPAEYLVNKLKTHGILTREQEQELFEIYRDGNPKESALAKERLILMNQRWVVSIIKKYVKYGANFDDLLQEGNLGLIRAIEKFDPDSGYRLSTYSKWWIIAYTVSYIEKTTHDIRFINTTDARRVNNHLNRVKSELKKTLGRKPTVEEIAEKLSASTEKVERAVAHKKGLKSLNAPLTPDGDTALGELIVGDSDTEEIIILKQLKRIRLEILEDALSTIRPRDAKIIKMRHRIDDSIVEEKAMTFDEVGQAMGISRERVRQLETRGLQQLTRYVRKFYPEEVS